MTYPREPSLYLQFQTFYAAYKTIKDAPNMATADTKKPILRTSPVKAGTVRPAAAALDEVVLVEVEALDAEANTAEQEDAADGLTT